MSDTFKNLNDILKKIPDEKKPIAKSLITELNFMKKTLNELKKEIKEKGSVELFKQGSQELYRESPACKIYLSMVGKYGNLHKQLCSLIPRSDDSPDPGEEDSDIYDFINGE